MPDSKSFRILFVDDDETTREVCSSLLESRGYQVACAGSGEEALDLLQRRGSRFDMVLLDLVMPGGMDGFETLREIRTAHSKAFLPVFMVTSREHRDDVMRALEEGADDYLVKPLAAGVSLAKIQATLELRAADQHNEVGPGDRLGSKYQLEELVGSGGFGTVFRATHLDLDVDLAIKVLHPHAFADFKSRKRLKTEGRVLARLDHPNTVRVWDLVTTEDPPYLVMNFLEGRALSEVMAEHGPMPPRLVCRVAQQITKGLQAAHKLDLVHRDIKPQNIFLCKNQPDGTTVKLLDFGLAGWSRESRREGSSSSGSQHELLGTPRYLAPERILGERGDKPSDVYSLGIVVFEMLTGSFPYPVRSGSLASLIQAHATGKVSRFSDLGVKVPALLEGLIRWMLRREPDQRARCEQVLDSLDEIGSSLGNDPATPTRTHLDLSGRADTELINLADLGHTEDD